MFYSCYSGQIVLGKGRRYDYKIYEQNLNLIVKNGLVQSDSVFIATASIAKIKLINDIQIATNAFSDSLEKHMNTSFSNSAF